jgi:hypothetical protein
MLKIKIRQLVIVIVTITLTACSVLAITYECSRCDGYSGWSSDDGGQPPDCNPKTSTRTLGSCVDASPATTTCSESSKATKMVRYYYKYQDVDCLMDCNAKKIVCKLACLTAPPLVKELCNWWCDKMYENCLELCIECELTSGPIPSDYEDGCV